MQGAPGRASGMLLALKFLVRVGACTGPGPALCSLPAGAALRQALQNGLQVLLVGKDFRQVALESLNLLLLLLRLPLQVAQLLC